jgi:zona occludens toxin
MINLFTGAGGTGKTCYTISEMLRITGEGRPLFVHGVPDLKIPHETVICTSPNCMVCPQDRKEREGVLLAEEWHQWAPDGAVLLFDEVQNVYRARSSSLKPLDSIMAFETHRHRGLDFYLISQAPMLFDPNLRRLVNKHIHLTGSWARRIQYEWPECSSSLSLTSAIKSSYNLDKKVFGLYKSAVLHTTVKRKIPSAVYATGVLLVALLFGANTVYSNLQARTAPITAYLSDDEEINSPSPVLTSTASVESLPNDFYALSREPIIKNRPESAPIYSTVIEVTDFPVLLAVIIKEETGECKAFTQQGTLYKTSQRNCHLFYKGRIFNPYKTHLEEKRDNKTNGEGGVASAAPASPIFVEDDFS